MTETRIRKTLALHWNEDMSFSSGRILGSMCSEPDLLAAQIFAESIEKNIGDTGLFPGTKRLEEEALRIIASFLSGPQAVGSLVTGGTEANFVALLAAKNRSGKPAARSCFRFFPFSSTRAAAFMTRTKSPQNILLCKRENKSKRL
jgi:tyrosine decarboxylase/aspartate 1-decarboxylase